MSKGCQVSAEALSFAWDRYEPGQLVAGRLGGECAPLIGSHQALTGVKC